MIDIVRRSSEISISIYLILAGCEWLYLCSDPDTRVFFQPDVIALRLQERWWGKSAATLASHLLRLVGRMTLPALVVIFGAALLVSSLMSHQSVYIVLACLISLVLCHAIFSFGLEGADQMALLVLITQGAVLMFPQQEWTFEVFLTGQLIASYVTAGVAKLLSDTWRCGDVLPRLLTRSRRAKVEPGRILRCKGFVRLLTYAIIVFELSWLVAPFNVGFLYGLVALGTIFHFALAVRMGLNLFPWAFLAAYPVAIDAVLKLHEHHL